MFFSDFIRVHIFSVPEWLRAEDCGTQNAVFQKLAVKVLDS